MAVSSPLVYDSEPMTHPGLPVFGFGKFLYVIGIFGSFNFLEGASTGGLLAFLFKSYFCCALVLVALHKPWKSKNLMKISMISKIAPTSGLHVISFYLLSFGLSSCGPIRFILLEHFNIIISRIISIVLSSSQEIQGSRMQGCVIAMLGYFLCLWHDPTDSRISNAYKEDVYDENTFDLFVGICAIIISQAVQIFANNHETRLYDETGSVKRVQAMQATLALPILAVMIYLHSSSFPLADAESTSQGAFVTVCGGVFITIRALLTAWQLQLHIPDNSAMRWSVSICVCFAIILHIFHFDLSGIRSPTFQQYSPAPDKRDKFVIGTSTGTGLALYTSAVLATVATFRFTAQTMLMPISSVFRVLATHLPNQERSSLGQILHRLLHNSDARKMSIYLVANLCYMTIEFWYGLSSESQSLMSDSVHMLYDCVSISIGFACSYVMTLPYNREDRAFGYERMDVIGGFLNGIFLIMSSISVFMCAVERRFEPDKIHSEHLLVVSLCQMALCAIGVKVFTQPRDSLQTRKSNRISLNTRGVYLHALAGFLSASACAFSSLLSHYLRWYSADPLSSFCICLIIWPLGVGDLLGTTTMILCLRQPIDQDEQIQFGMREIQAMDDLKVVHRKFWSVSLKHARGALRIEANSIPKHLYQQLELLDIQTTTQVNIV
eukprot:GEMP01020831.1.p1 GENE.GEMP01020831.1~~GEMP01020831.1.p1  ORF type:complete len:665 (+),score=47.81 GEMP01020831.1:68-2062(+)